MIEEFVTAATQRSAELKAWGYYVSAEVTKVVCPTGDRDASILKMHPKVRIKQESSIRGKIARYPDVPFAELFTDLVGVRFVVLLTSEIKTIEDVIEEHSSWKFKKVRDFGEQAKNNPELFDYQSVHYILTANKEITYSGQRISAGTTCELQIRTLLQHAYAELTHDNIYKPTQIVPAKAKRFVARSMALMEATDDLFCRTLEELKSANLQRNQVYDGLVELYKNLFPSHSTKINRLLNLEIIDVYLNIFPIDVLSRVRSLFTASPELTAKVALRMREKFLFQQPVVLLIYLLVMENDFSVRKRWKFMSLWEELRLIFSDLGNGLGDRQ